MSVNNSHHVSHQALARYEIPDPQWTNHWSSLPYDTIFIIFNFVLSGRSESPSPNALLRLIRLNCKTVCRISFISKAFSSCFSHYSNKIGNMTNKDLDIWKRKLETNRPDILSISTLHYDLQLAKETISYWNKVGAKSTNKNSTSANSQKDMVQNGLNGAAELSAYGLLSYEQVMDFISSLPNEMKESTYSYICHEFLKMKLFPLVVRLIQENYITNNDTLIKITQGILSHIEFLADELDQDVITFIHDEIMHENLSEIFPYTDKKFHDVLDYALKKGFFEDNIELIQGFIEKNSPENSVELEKTLGERAWLENIFFGHLVKNHLFDQALEFGKVLQVKLTTMAIHLIAEKQYKLVLGLIRTLNNNEMNNFISVLLDCFCYGMNERFIDFFSIILNPQKAKKIKKTDNLMYSFASIIRRKLNPLKQEVVIKFFQKTDQSCLLEHFDWSLATNEKELINFFSTPFENEEKILIFLAKRMKIKFTPVILRDIYSLRGGYHRAKHPRDYNCYTNHYPDEGTQKFLVNLYRLVCDTTLDPSRKQWFKEFFDLFPPDSFFMQEFEKISPEHAAWIQEMRVPEQTPEQKYSFYLEKFGRLSPEDAERQQIRLSAQKKKKKKFFQ